MQAEVAGLLELAAPREGASEGARGRQREGGPLAHDVPIASQRGAQLVDTLPRDGGGQLGGQLRRRKAGPSRGCGGYVGAIVGAAVLGVVGRAGRLLLARLQQRLEATDCAGGQGERLSLALPPAGCWGLGPRVGTWQTPHVSRAAARSAARATT